MLDTSLDLYNCCRVCADGVFLRDIGVLFEFSEKTGLISLFFHPVVYNWHHWLNWVHFWCSYCVFRDWREELLNVWLLGGDPCLFRTLIAVVPNQLLQKESDHAFVLFIKSVNVKLVSKFLNRVQNYTSFLDIFTSLSFYWHFVQSLLIADVLWWVQCSFEISHERFRSIQHLYAAQYTILHLYVHSSCVYLWILVCGPTQEGWDTPTLNNNCGRDRLEVKT